MSVSAINGGGGGGEPIGIARERKLLEEAAQADAMKMKGIDVRIAAFDELDKYRTGLYDTLSTLADAGTLNARQVALGNPESTILSATASPNALIGAHTFTITALATPTRIQSAQSQGNALEPQDITLGSVDPGPLLSVLNLPGLTAGSLTLALGPDANGKAITVTPLKVDFADSLRNFFEQIKTATGGDVIASYSTDTDRITLTSQSGRDITLGAPNDDSNFWAVTHLFSTKHDPSTGPRPAIQSTTSEIGLGCVDTRTKIADCNLKNVGHIASGQQTLTLNGEKITYDIATDSLSDVIRRIESSRAGVQLLYNRSTDAFSLNNQETGALAINTSDTGGLLNALGLMGAGATLVSGNNARLQVDNGPIISSTSNTIDGTTHGITGLGLTLKSTGTETTKVSADTEPAKKAVGTFIEAYNKYVDFARDKTASTKVNGKLVKGILAQNNDLVRFNNALRADLTSTSVPNNNIIKTLGMLGITTSKTIEDPKISLNDPTFTAHLTENPAEALNVLSVLAEKLKTPIAPYINSSLRNLPDGIYKTPQDDLRNKKTRLQADQLKKQQSIDKKDKQIEADSYRIQAAQLRGQQMSGMFAQATGG